MADEEQVKPDTAVVAMVLAGHVINDAYKDLVGPAARETGRNLETAAKTVTVALAPLRLMIWGFERIEAYLVDALSRRLEQVPADKIITPDPMLAGPAVESLRYAGHHDELREMYANLLAAGMTADTAEFAHPAFADIIRQLTPDEAKLLKAVAMRCPSRLLQLDDRGWFERVGKEVGLARPELTKAAFDNFLRLRVLEFQPAEKATYASLRRTESEDGEYEPVLESWPACYIWTEFGKRFVRVCVLGPSDVPKGGGQPLGF